MELIIEEPKLNSFNNYSFAELDSKELQEINGGEPATATGATALAIGCGVTLGALLLGVAVGVGIYYGVKYLMK